MPDPMPQPDRPMLDWKRRFIFVYAVIGLAVGTWKLIESFPSRGEDAATPFSIMNFAFAGEGRFILTALLAGVVGGFIHIAVSYAAYRANDALTDRWFAWYLLRPLIGGGLAMAFYAVIRAGFVAPGTSTDATAQILSPYGILAVGLLVGLCNAQAEKKLRSVGQALFDTSKGKDDYEARKTVQPEASTPAISGTEPQSLPAAVAGRTLRVRGTGFDASTASVFFDNKPLKVVERTPSEILCAFGEDAANLPGGDRTLIVTNNGLVPKTSAPYTVVVR